MEKISVKIWGTDWPLDVIYDCYEGEEILPEQKEALQKILSTDVFDSCKPSVIEYILKRDGEEEGLQSIDEVREYVHPQTIYLVRESGKRVVALLCDYKFDIEHGIAIVFENEKFKEVVVQDEVI